MSLLELCNTLWEHSWVSSDPCEDVSHDLFVLCEHSEAPLTQFFLRSSKAWRERVAAKTIGSTGARGSRDGRRWRAEARPGASASTVFNIDVEGLRLPTRRSR